jgi:hypothetical protein
MFHEQEPQPNMLEIKTNHIQSYCTKVPRETIEKLLLQNNLDVNSVNVILQEKITKMARQDNVMLTPPPRVMYTKQKLKNKIRRALRNQNADDSELDIESNGSLDNDEGTLQSKQSDLLNPSIDCFEYLDEKVLFKMINDCRDTGDLEMIVEELLLLQSSCKEEMSMVMSENYILKKEMVRQSKCVESERKVKHLLEKEIGKVEKVLGEIKDKNKKQQLTLFG